MIILVTYKESYRCRLYQQRVLLEEKNKQTNTLYYLNVEEPQPD